MAIDVTGKLHLIFDTKKVSDRFTKREFVVEIADGKYPQMVLFQLTGDRCNVLDRFSVGDAIRVSFDLRGREWRSPTGEVKYFNSLDAWRLEPAGTNTSAGRRGNGDREAPAFEPSFPVAEYEPRPTDLGPTRDDDIPF